MRWSTPSWCAAAIEAAIVEHRRVLLQRYPGVGSFADSPAGELRVWPLQLVFHNVGWYLLFEEDQVGREQGLLRSERLDRLAMARGDGDLRRNPEQHAAAIHRLERLLHQSGGIYFGSDREQQLAVASSSAQLRSQALVTLRFCCSPWAFAFIREGLQREHINDLHPEAGLALAGIGRTEHQGIALTADAALHLHVGGHGARPLWDAAQVCPAEQRLS